MNLSSSDLIILRRSLLKTREIIRLLSTLIKAK